MKRLIAAAGYPADEISFAGITFEQMRPGCWKQQDRLADMDLNGVQAQLCYPNYPRFAGQIFLYGKDRELALLCVQAYNDWMVRGVVRRVGRAAGPALPGAAVGCRAGGPGGTA